MAQRNGGLCERVAQKLRSLLIVHWPTLQGEAFQRCGRELLQVFAVLPTKESLGRDVKKDRHRNLVSKPAGEIFGRNLFVHAVEAAMGYLFIEPMQHVADVVQERGGNRGRAGASQLGGVGRLQAVLKDGDGLSEICAPSLALSRSIRLSIVAVVMVRTPRS